MAEQLAAEFDGEDELTGGDHYEHPALCAQTLALGVSDVGVELAGRWCCHEADHQDSGHTDRVFCRQWEDVLHEEGVQLNHLPKEITRLSKLHKFRKRNQPARCT